MSARPLILFVALGAALAACETLPMGDSGTRGAVSSAFRAGDFDWSAGSGREARLLRCWFPATAGLLRVGHRKVRQNHNAC